MLKDQLDTIKNAAAVNFLGSGSLMPVFISDLNKGFTIMPLLWRNPGDKDAFSEQLGRWISGGDITEYIMVAEAWALKKDVKELPIAEINEWMRENGSLEHHPERTEGIMIQYCSAKEEVDLFAEIKRDGDKVELGEWSTNVRDKAMNVNPVDLGSRFGGVFAKSNAGLN